MIQGEAIAAAVYMRAVGADAIDASGLMNERLQALGIDSKTLTVTDKSYSREFAMRSVAALGRALKYALRLG